MIRAEDLMIGDWVLCDGKPYQIAEIGGMVCLDAEEELFASFEDIEPIPLTPEILEKNGFKKYNSYGTEKYSLNDKVSVNLYGADKWLLRVDVPYNFEKTYIVFQYVHELQHALRLCGIDINIEV